jgi:AraC-like DNA-binding protein
MGRTSTSVGSRRIVDLAEQLTRQGEPVADGAFVGAHGLTVVQHASPTTAETTLYRPVACLILRGLKETAFGGRPTRVGEGQVLLISHDVPLVARVRRAPYLAVVLTLDLATLRALQDDLGGAALAPGEPAASHRVDEADGALVDAFERLLALVVDGSEADVRVVGGLTHRELHYRLLTSPAGAMLRDLIRHDSHASAVAQAIRTLHRDFRAPLRVEALAREVAMSVSSFHKHFKAVTATSPLQYQKTLRLLEARRLLAEPGAAVSTAAFAVGYESPTQFCRDYVRRFGHPPSRAQRLGQRGRGAGAASPGRAARAG